MFLLGAELNVFSIKCKLILCKQFLCQYFIQENKKSEYKILLKVIK